MQVELANDFAILAKLCTEEYATPKRYTGMNVTIDLTTQQGRWELVVLALLLAARISETVAEHTFHLLRECGLLVFDRVLKQGLADVTQTQEILQTEYRALINRNRKVMAIYANAKWLKEHYQGDIQNIYDSCFNVTTTQSEDAADLYEEEATSAGKELTRCLRQLHQIDNRARWICRVMKEAELWPLVPVESTIYFDRHVRCVLQRQGLVSSGPLKDQLQDAEDAIGYLFGGDTIGLYRLGKYLCQKHDPALCKEKCCLYESCGYRNSPELQLSTEVMDT
jgi:hypothetical protein